MRILIYKRTHTGDPDNKGRFGIYNCMGRIRNYTFDAVIGVGGIGQEPKKYGIDRKINWVGINPKKRQRVGGTGAIVTFKKFILLEEQGPLLRTLAPLLANRMYGRGARILLNGYSALARAEAEAILQWAMGQTSPKSVGLKRASNAQGCPSKCKPAISKESQC